MAVNAGSTGPGVNLTGPVISMESHQLPSNPDLTSVTSHPVHRPPSRADWEQIQQLRFHNWSLRSQIHELRATLRERQQVKSVADDKLFKSMKYGMMPELSVLADRGDGSYKGQKTIDEMKQDCQDARDSYGPLEDDCNHLEDRLSEQEFELTRLERQLYSSRNESAAWSTEIPRYPSSQHPKSPSSSFHEDEIENSEYHPLVTQYLSGLGDLDLLQERHAELLEEREILEEEKTYRLSFGRTLDPDDQNWLETSHSAENELLQRIRHMEKHVEEMKIVCLSIGLVDEDGEPTSFQTQEQVSFNGEKDVDPREHKSEYVKYPLLLPQPGKKYEGRDDFVPSPDQELDITTSRINGWILDQLRTSPLEVNLLARTFEGKVGDINDGWQVAVLSLWYKDGTIKTAAARRFSVYTSSMTAPSLSVTTGSISKQSKLCQKPPNDSNDGSFHIFLASSIQFPPDPPDAAEFAFLVRKPPSTPEADLF